MKTFTLDEAQSLLPVLESLLKRAIESKTAAEVIEAELSELSRRIYVSGGMHIDVTKIAAQRTAMKAHENRAREIVSEIDDIGVQLKDLDIGLLYFPCRDEDEVVLLCWKMGEESIDFWHTEESGFRGRQPVDDRFLRRANSGNRPN